LRRDTRARVGDLRLIRGPSRLGSATAPSPTGGFPLCQVARPKLPLRGRGPNGSEGWIADLRASRRERLGRAESSPRHPGTKRQISDTSCTGERLTMPAIWQTHL
jgi:hypothetical protein